MILTRAAESGEIMTYDKKYYEAHKAEILQERKLYYQTHLPGIRDYMRVYMRNYIQKRKYKANRKRYMKKYYLEHRDKFLERSSNQWQRMKAMMIQGVQT